MTSELWRNRPFRALWIGETVSQLGDRITELALPLIAITLLSATAGQVGILTAAVWAPNLLALVVGAWVDRRTHKRRLLIVADLARAVVLLSLPLAYLLDVLTLAQLYAVALLTGVGQVLFTLAYQSFFVALVPEPSYVDASSKLSLSRAASFVGGPALGGVLVQALTAPVAIVADTLSFLGSALMIGRIRIAERPPAATGPPMGRLIADGFGLVLQQPILRASLACTALINFFTLAANAILIVFASRELGLSPAAIGFAFGVGAFGGVLGAALAPRVSRWLGVGPTTIIGAALFPAPIGVMAFAAGPHWAAMAVLAAMELLSGFGVMLMDINLNALMIHATPDDARGRRAGAHSAVNYGIRPLGALTGGWLATAIGLRHTLLLAGVGGTLAVLFLVASPVRRIASLAAPDLQMSMRVGT